MLLLGVIDAISKVVFIENVTSCKANDDDDVEMGMDQVGELSLLSAIMCCSSTESRGLAWSRQSMLMKITTINYGVT